MSLRDSIKKLVTKAKGSETTGGQMYLYDTKENRESTISYLVEYAKTNKSTQTIKMRMLDDYYNNKHKTQLEIQKTCKDKNLPFIPAIIPYPHQIVEGLIIPEIPDFEFRGRDDDLDSQRAKQRQYVVQYVIEDNKLDNMNTENERQLNKLGNAFWKVAFDYGLKDGESQGKIIIGNPDAANIFPDPSAYSVEDCEYIAYLYRMHKMKIARVFKNELKKLDLTINEIISDGVRMDTEIYNSQSQDIYDDTMQVTEFWYRQPEDGKEVFEYVVDGKTVKREVEWEAGDIACSIMIGKTEIKRIPKYWEKTGLQNKLYPFIKYCKIPVNKSFWDMSELEPIIDLVDAADREFSTMQLNDVFNANDIIIMPENALADDTEIENTPGAIWKTKNSVLPGSIQRLGGLGNLNGGIKDTINFIGDHIKNTVGLFDIQNGGAPPANVKTLGALVELKQQGEKRLSLKKADRNSGFESLFELIDWTALEFYDDDRMIFIGAEGDVKDQAIIDANGGMSQEQQIEYAQQQQIEQQQAQATGQQAPPQQPPNMDRKKGPVIFKYNSSQYNKDGYYPRIDAKISVGDGIVHNKAFTLSALETIAQMNITVANYKIVCSMVDVMQLPDRKEIKQFLESYFSNMQMGIPKTTMAFKDLSPEAKVQMLAKVGINAPPPPEMDFAGTPYDILLKNKATSEANITNESTNQPKIQNAFTQDDYQKIFNSLSHEDKLHLQQNPQLLEELVKKHGGIQQ